MYKQLAVCRLSASSASVYIRQLIGHLRVWILRLLRFYGCLLFISPN